MRKIIIFALSLILLTSIFSFTPKKAAKKMKHIMECYSSAVVAGAVYTATIRNLQSSGNIIYETTGVTQSGTSSCYLISYGPSPFIAGN